VDTKEKLKIIQEVSGLTQTEIATKVGVSFVALNTWWNGKSLPRQKHLLAIDLLYKEFTGQNIIPESVLIAKKDLVDRKSKKFKSILNTILNNPDIYDQFMLSLTYNSNKIEGSTLSENETADIIFNNRALPNKSIIEQLEVKNHQTSLQYLFSFLKEGKKIDEKLVLKLHAILMNGIRADAGLYRSQSVRIVGANVPTANFLKIPVLMRQIIKDINKKQNDRIGQVSNIHARFEKIHPFSDGNGRIGRLVLVAMLTQHNIAPAVIKQSEKLLYNTCLQRAQQREDYTQLEEFICRSVMSGFDILIRKTIP